MNLKDDIFRLYHKPQDKLQCMYLKSNHPSNVIKQVSTSIENRLSNLSSNMKSIINNNNMKVLNDTVEIEESCSCRNKNNFPLDRKCLNTNIYEAKITSNQRYYKEKAYIGTAEVDFKHSFNNHTKSFNLKQ